MATVIISNETITNIMQILNYLQDAGLLTTGFSLIIKNEAKEQKDEFQVSYQVQQILVYQKF